MANRPELLVTTGPNAGKRLEVPPAGLRMGRSSSNDLHIPDEELSRNHCIFERVGEDGIRVIDLASANGTFVNGVRVGAEARPLSPGDVIDAGTVRIRVVGSGGEPAPIAQSASGAVDLGLGGAASGGAPGGGGKVPPPRSPLAGLLWAVAAVAAIAAIAAVLLAPVGPKEPSAATTAQPADAGREIVHVMYEKVEADAARVFRYLMEFDGRTGTLKVVYDDVPAADRHAAKSERLDAKASERMREIVDSRGWEALDKEYSGPSASNENALRSWRIRVVRTGGVKDVLVENTMEPEAFRHVREALEAFSLNELGVRAIQYSKERLLELSAESEKVGAAKWDERDVEYGNLSGCIKAYKEAAFYLETVNPKPAGYGALRERLAAAVAELDRRYREQRFRADRAINLGKWDDARAELRVLCELVPDKDDERHVEASAKLVDVERRMKEQKDGRKKKRGKEGR